MSRGLKRIVKLQDIGFKQGRTKVTDEPIRIHRGDIRGAENGGPIGEWIRRRPGRPRDYGLPV